MNLKENTNYLGEVSVNDVPSGKFDIALSFSSKGVFFELYAISPPKVSYGILVGTLFGYGDFTLINSSQQSVHNGIYKYKADYLIAGRKFQSKESLVFTRYKVYIHNLSVWIGKEFWNVNLSQSIKLEESLYSKEISIVKGAILKIANDWELSQNYRSNNLNLKGYSYIELITVNKRKGFCFDYTFIFFSNLLKFLSLISGRKYRASEISCVIESPNPSDKNIYSLSFPVYREINETENEYTFGEFSLEFNEIDDLLQNLLIGWNNRDDLFHIIDLNLTFCLYKNSSRNTHFLNAFACLEGIDKHINGVKGKARERLFRYLPYFKEIYPESVDKFIDSCLNTRNYFAHGKKNKDEYIFNNFELLYAAKALVNISRVLILKELGLPENLLSAKFTAIATDLKNLMRSNKWFNQGLIDIPKI